MITTTFRSLLRKYPRGVGRHMLLWRCCSSYVHFKLTSHSRAHDQAAAKTNSAFRRCMHAYIPIISVRAMMSGCCCHRMAQDDIWPSDLPSTYMHMATEERKTCASRVRITFSGNFYLICKSQLLQLKQYNPKTKFVTRKLSGEKCQP